AHRLKNDATLTNRALDSLACRRRVLLSGTPLQNRLDEFYGGCHATGEKGAGKEAEGFEGCASFFPPNTFGGGRTGRGGMNPGWELLSGKFAVLAGLLGLLRSCTRDRIVVVSNYTQTLDLVAQ
ncbi:hypothetical protein CHLNCDRAFT_55816, partial [Chlorella variabilis]